MFHLHGMEPGEVVPTRELFLSHVLADDRAAVAEALEPRGDVEARTCEYRLVDLTGTERQVMLAVANEGPGGAVGTAGFVIDETASREANVASRVNDQLTVALESHAAIDQAKGVLMLTYGIDGDAAFGVLRSSSQQHNVRLRTLASRVMAAVEGGVDDAARHRVDQVVCGALADAAPRATSAGSSLSIHNEARADVPTLHVAGVVDLSNKDDLVAAVALLVLRGGVDGKVVLDLRELRRVGPVVGDVVATALRRSADHGVVMTVVGGRPRRTAVRERHATASSAPAGDTTATARN
jgi:anti-anti-sigma regulatory factor